MFRYCINSKEASSTTWFMLTIVVVKKINFAGGVSRESFRGDAVDPILILSSQTLEFLLTALKLWRWIESQGSMEMTSMGFVAQSTSVVLMVGICAVDMTTLCFEVKRKNWSVSIYNSWSHIQHPRWSPVSFFEHPHIFWVQFNLLLCFTPRRRNHRKSLQSRAIRHFSPRKTFRTRIPTQVSCPRRPSGGWRDYYGRDFSSPWSWVIWEIWQKRTRVGTTMISFCLFTRALR